MTNIITRFKEWAGTFLPLTPDQGPQEEATPATPPTSVDPIYEKMTKRELEEYARKEFNVELDRRHNKKRLLNQIKKIQVSKRDCS